jgi:predicted ATPase
MANIVTGWAEAAEGNAAAGLAQLRSGLDEMNRMEAQLRMPWYLALLAEVQGARGAIGDALAGVSAGFAFAGRNRETWALPELHRVEGNLLLAAGQPEEARNSFRQGVEAARQAGSRAFERKLARLAGGTAKTASTERS